MLDSLFGEEFEGGAVDSESVSRKPGIESPPRSRVQCGLSGIANQGATCYLNSLLQTLLYTPEFRDGLFCLGEIQLGKLADADKPNAKVRVIPIQLQRLFAQLLLKNCQSISSQELTESFGWTNNEQFQQHDVQELNRILFSAVESSLVGTDGKDLIQQLYHGKIVNQIECKECGKISEREEDFLDLPVTVAGNDSVEEALKAAYIEVEMLDGRNQYRCSGCQKLVDAAKGAKLRCLPPILTVSLLRFSFDFQRLERYKETRKFTFPHNINMQAYCDKTVEGEDMEYELFSVVIHSGGAYGGHYHAYIRDVDSLGNWIPPEDEEIVVRTDATPGGVVECDTPLELIQFLLQKQKNKGMPVDKLGQEIMKETGTSWNKRFKSRHGSMGKFLTKYPDTFIYDNSHNHVSLNLNAEKPCSPTKGHNSPTKGGNFTSKSDNDVSLKYKPVAKKQLSIPEGSQRSEEKEDDNTEAGQGDQKHGAGNRPGAIPNPGKAWYDFNDSNVGPIYERQIERQFAGRESAYMLFYRRRTLVRPNAAHDNKTYGMHEDLVTEVVMENELLDAQRKEYDVAVNRLTLQIHFSVWCQYREGAIKPLKGHNDWRELIIDQRKPVSDLYKAIREFGVELVPRRNLQINKYKELPAGGHLYDSVPDEDGLHIQHMDIRDGSKLFVWNGDTVDGVPVPTGLEFEPVFLNVIYGEDLQFSQGYAKNCSLQEVMIIVCEVIRIKAKNIRLKRLYGKDKEVKVVPFAATEINSTIEELKLQDGDQLLAEDKTQEGCGMSEEGITNTVFSSKFLVHVENRCVASAGEACEYLKTRLEVDKTISVAELKAMVTTSFGLMSIQDGGRLRIDHDTHGLRHPIHEEMSVFEAGITQGSNLVLEPGPAPLSDEITVSITSEDSSSGPDYTEVMMKQSATVDQCLQCFLNKANIHEGDWHLRKTNWCGEAAELLDDPDLSLEENRVSDGDVLLLEKGRLPPKGFIRLTVWLHSTPQSYKMAAAPNSTLACLMDSIYNIFNFNGGSNSGNNETSSTEAISSKPHPVHLGEVEISKEATLSDLKQQILTLNVVAELPIPSPDFMRLRLIESKRLSTVLRDENQTLKRLKLSSNSVLALQILPEEEKLHQQQVVLEVCQRVPDTRRYNPGVELVWDSGQGPSVEKLQQAISEVLYVDTQHICMAKHFPQRYEWLVLEHLEKQGNKKGKGKGKTNLRQAPFNIRDGDTIGVKDMQYDPNNIDDFTTDEDIAGQQALQLEIEEKRKMRDERKRMVDGFGPAKVKRKPEVGITIKVGDFT